MSEQKNLRQSYGTFELIGEITVIPNETFQTDLKGKNNKDFNYSRINMRMEDGKGGVFYLNAMDGFDQVKGRTIYARIKDSDTFEMMKVNFADRHNEEILKHIDNQSFVSVALQKVENEEGKLVWDYKNFLALYDAINFVKDKLETGMRLRVTGQTRYSTYNGNTQTEFQIGNIFLLSEEDTYENGFIFRQDVILKEDSLNLDKWDDELIAEINGEVLMKSRGQYQLLKLPMVMRANEENKNTVQRVIDKFLKVEEGKVRRIKLEGRYNTGYTEAKITKEDLPEEALELLELELYSLEEVLKMYAKGDRVDELLAVRPVVQRRRGEKPQIDLSDDDYTLEDLSNLEVEVPWEKEVEVSSDDSDDDDLSFLDEL